MKLNENTLEKLHTLQGDTLLFFLIKKNQLVSSQAISKICQNSLAIMWKFRATCHHSIKLSYILRSLKTIKFVFFFFK